MQQVFCAGCLRSSSLKPNLLFSDGSSSDSFCEIRDIIKQFSWTKIKLKYSSLSIAAHILIYTSWDAPLVRAWSLVGSVKRRTSSRGGWSVEAEEEKKDQIIIGWNETFPHVPATSVKHRDSVFCSCPLTCLPKVKVFNWITSFSPELTADLNPDRFLNFLNRRPKSLDFFNEWELLVSSLVLVLFLCRTGRFCDHRLTRPSVWCHCYQTNWIQRWRL